MWWDSYEKKKKISPFVTLSERKEKKTEITYLPFYFVLCKYIIRKKLKFQIKQSKNLHNFYSITIPSYFFLCYFFLNSNKGEMKLKSYRTRKWNRLLPRRQAFCPQFTYNVFQLFTSLALPNQKSLNVCLDQLWKINYFNSQLYI